MTNDDEGPGPRIRTGNNTQQLYALRPQPTPDDALKRLLEGNTRFASNVRSIDSLVSHLRRAELAAGQRPYAIIVGCSDSRAPAEIIFDQGLGDLFVIRVAGPIIGPSQIGSVEFACEKFDTPLVLVMGHTTCGAIQATISEILEPEPKQSNHVLSIVNRIRPSIDGLVRQHRHSSRPELVEVAVKANVRACVEQLRSGSGIIEQRIIDGRLRIVGAEYHLETGKIELVP